MARIMIITRSGMNPEAIEELISWRVEEVLAAQEVNRNAGLIDENQSQNGDDNDNGSGGNGKHGNHNGDGNQNGGNRGAKRDAPVARVCTYKDFLNCQPHNFSGTEGVVGLARWFEKIDSVFRISNCPPNSQVKFATFTLLDEALTWNEIQKLENELWNLCVKGTDVAGYTQRFQKLTLLCPKMVLEENDKIERFIWGLLDNIQGNVTSSKLVRLQDAIRMANGLMDQKVRVYAARKAEQKRKFDNNPRGNRVQPPPFKRTAIATQTPRAPVVNQRVVTCFGCGGQGHYKSDCPKLKNQNHGNKVARNDARRRAYAL
ncbi:reverse transcriptase domain-containing protein [Tanacetum coccineum]